MRYALDFHLRSIDDSGIDSIANGDGEILINWNERTPRSVSGSRTIIEIEFAKEIFHSRQLMDNED